MVNGCKDTIEGLNAKVSLVKTFVDAEGPSKQNLLNVLCWLHLMEERETPPCPPAPIKIDSEKLLSIIQWQRPASSGPPTAAQDYSNPGVYLTSALEACKPEDMAAVAAGYMNANPQVNMIDALRYVNYRGFIKVDSNALIAPSVTGWKKPTPEGKEPPNWHKVWGEYLPTNPNPTYVNVRDIRGRRAKIAFLGVPGDSAAHSKLKTPHDVLMGPPWYEKPPPLCIHCDAGSMHPLKCDSEMMLCNLPQFKDWVDAAARGEDEPEASDAVISQAASKEGSKKGSRRASRDTSPKASKRGSKESLSGKGSKQSSKENSPKARRKGKDQHPRASPVIVEEQAEPPPPPDIESGLPPALHSKGLPPIAESAKPKLGGKWGAARKGLPPVAGWQAVRTAMKDQTIAKMAKIVDMNGLVRRTVADWQNSLKEIDTDKTLADGSINNLIYLKLKEVFGALLDAAKLADAWFIVDRTDGEGSATAELLLEHALERLPNVAQRPTIIAIDSLERLGNAREMCERDGRKLVTRSHKMLRQLSLLYNDEDGAKQEPSGLEKDLLIDWYYSLDEFDKPSTYSEVDDARLPFPVLADHRRKHLVGAEHDTCHPNRKWRYYYIDGLFRNATHYIIKTNDADEFDIEGFARSGFVYAHGDTRTYKRLRANIQQGKQLVMLHNSGGVTTAFSWLQRVMAFARPPPAPDVLRAPLKFLISNLSKANWVHDFGVPEVIMMKGLAERAPLLFRTGIASVDILTDSEEHMLAVIEGSFSSVGGVPELGLGSAEVNVVFNAWNLHMTLCQNAKSFKSKSVIMQFLVQLLALITTLIAITISSFGVGYTPGSGAADPVGSYNPVLLRYGKLSPQVTDIVTFTLNKVLIFLPIFTALVTMGASKTRFRDKWSVCISAASQLTFEIYKFRMLTLEYDMSSVAAGGKEQSRLARNLFVERIQAFYSACMTELTHGAEGIKQKRPKVSNEERHDYRAEQENRPTLAQWFKIKTHVETHYYQTGWMLPPTGFVTWLEGLRPYVQHRTLREELRAVLEAMVTSKKVKIEGTNKPLNKKQASSVRQELAKAFGLKKTMLEAQHDEIRQVQREVIVEMMREQVEERNSSSRRESSSRDSGMGGASSSPEKGLRGLKNKGERGGSSSKSPKREKGGGASKKESEEEEEPKKSPKKRRKKGANEEEGTTEESEGEEGASVLQAASRKSRKSLAGAPAAAPAAAPVTPPAAVPGGEDPVFIDEADAMRKVIMELQGLKYGKLTVKEKQEEKKAKNEMLAKEVEDDYLAGSLSTTSYVVFRVRPLIESYETQAIGLAKRLQWLEIAALLANLAGVVFATGFVNFGEWVSLTVVLVALLTGVLEFTQLKNRVVYINLSIGELRNLLVWWDSLSVVRRRSSAVKAHVVDTTERAILQVVDAQTTAAANAQILVEKQLARTSYCGGSGERESVAEERG